MQKRLAKLHRQLHKKYTWYDKWHKFKYHYHIHLGILATVALILGATLFSLSLPSPAVSEKTKSYEFTNARNYIFNPSKISFTTGEGVELKSKAGSYPDDLPLVQLKESFTQPFITITSFYEKASKDGGEVYYQVSNDGGKSYFFYNGQAWVLAQPYQFNTATTINKNIDSLLGGDFSFRVFLRSNGKQRVNLKSVSFKYVNDLKVGLASGSNDDDDDNNGACNCDSKAKILEVQYNGLSNVTVNVWTKNIGDTLVASFNNVQTGQYLLVDASNLPKGSLESTTEFAVVETGEISNIHTSCSQPLLGVTAGSFTVISFVTKNGSICQNLVCGDGNIDPGEECDDGNLIDGDGCSAQCTIEEPPFCGNGILDPGEACDDGNLLNGDGCSAQCTVEECGNGVLDAGEQCDDGNLIDGDGCSAQCTIEEPPFCGNGILDPGEACDDGNLLNGDDCSAQCTVEECGNGVLDAGEQCDDGNLIDGDGCSSQCTIEPPPACGDGVLDPGEDCDDGNNIDGDGCSAQCTVEQCGNGVLDFGEQCDDGNNLNGDGCSAICGIEICGNNILDPGEQCDDGNLVDGDGCSAQCTVEQCGNGVLDFGEQCDDGNGINGDGCNNQCKTEQCGNGVLDFGEQCDDGNNLNGDGCSAQCTIEPPPSCGDGALDPGEQCDDGNLVDGDGCSAICTVEQCGNSIVDPGEQCDDGNLIDGDGCSTLCVIELCGDGILQPALGEQCDDGNLIDGDGCSAVCNTEVCGNGILQPALGELCDDGNLVDGDGCSAQCTVEQCGNGVVDVGEQCDDGNNINGDGCSAQCTTEPPLACGNGVLDPGEQCDDGNNVDGDGCSAICNTEICGNGILEPPEQCDDGNNIDGDGCSAICTPEIPEPICGNGVIEAPEQCDDGNNIDGDGCSAICENETPLPFCGNGIVETGEQCDDGNNNNGDGCSAQCIVEPPPPPVCIGCGGGFAPPNGNIEIIECTPTKDIALEINASFTNSIEVSNSSNLANSTVFPFTGNPMNVNWQLEDPDGQKTVYAKFIGAAGLTANDSDTIELDQANHCEFPAPKCPFCDDFTYDLYIVNPDGVERHINTVYTKIEQVDEDTHRVLFEDSIAERVFFEDSLIIDMDYNDVVILVERQGCQYSFTVESVSASWHHQVRVKFFNGDVFEDVLLAQNSQEAIGQNLIEDASVYKALCEEIEFPAPPEPPACPDCSKLDYNLYIVNPDGSERHMKTVYAQIEEVSPTLRRVYFEDSRIIDTDYNDVVILVDKTDCNNITFTVESISASWHHEIWIDIFQEGFSSQKVLVTDDSHQAFGQQVSIDAHELTQLCKENGFELPARIEDVFDFGTTLFTSPNFSGASETFTTDDPDLSDNLLGNDAVSSLRIFGRVIVELFEDTFFGGKSETFVADNADLSEHIIDTKQTSSIKVRSLNENLPTITTPSVVPPVIPTPSPAVITPPTVLIGCTLDQPLVSFLDVGKINSEVRAVQELLKCLQFFPADIDATAIYGPVTAQAVTLFQIANGIDPVGYVGPSTRALLNTYLP